MNRTWTDPIGEKYECSHCGAEKRVSKDGYMPIHRRKGKRSRCDGSGSHKSFHKKVS